jgi:hypothetical protein
MQNTASTIPAEPDFLPTTAGSLCRNLQNGQILAVLRHSTGFPVKSRPQDYSNSSPLKNLRNLSFLCK